MFSDFPSHERLANITNILQLVFVKILKSIEMYFGDFQCYVNINFYGKCDFSCRELIQQNDTDSELWFYTAIKYCR